MWTFSKSHLRSSGGHSCLTNRTLQPIQRGGFRFSLIRKFCSLGRRGSYPDSRRGVRLWIGVSAVREGPAGRIFISYRREDTPHVAGRLFDRLEMRFGAGNIFMDVDSIEPGMDFAEAIEDAVGACDVLLVLIGPHWVDAIDENGRRRLADPDDFVALEITAALRRQIRVVPVLVDGVSQLRRRELPETLATLARRQSVRLDHTSFAAGVAALVIALERALRERAADLDDRPEPETIELEPGHERSSALTKRIGVAPG